MTADLSEFLQASRRPPGKPCGMRTILETLDDAQAAKLEAALATSVDTISHAAISRVLGGWGVEVSRNVVGHHRNGHCSCDR